MVRKVLYPAVFVLVLLMVSGAYATWSFESLFTLTPPTWPDGRFYDHTETGLLDGTYVQIIVGTESSAIVDPLEYFDYDDSGAVDTGTELADVTTWLNDGADPAEISGGLNQLVYNSTLTFTGELETQAGEVYFDYNEAPWNGSPPVIVPGVGMDLLAMRVWNVPKSGLESFCTVLGQEVWYTTDREMGTITSPPYSTPDSGWCVGMGEVPDGQNPLDYGWGFSATIGIEALMGARLNSTNVHLATCPIPEPSTMLLIGGSALLLLLRRKK
jgi:hypothetical protein